MAVSKLFRLINFALALILLLLVKSNSSEKFDHNARANDAADPVRRISSLIDSSGKLRIGNERQFERNSRDVFAVMESNSINTAEDVKSYEGEEKKRNKKAVPLLVPLVLLLWQAIAAAFGIAAADAGAAVIAQNDPVQLPQLWKLFFPEAIYATPRTISIPKPTYKPNLINGSIGENAPNNTSDDLGEDEDLDLSDLFGLGEHESNYPPDDLCKDGVWKPSEQTGRTFFQRLTIMQQFENLANGKFAKLKWVTAKTPTVKNADWLLRPRWKDMVTGEIYEWDSQHGELEVYDKSGKPLKVLDPCTGNDKDKDISDQHPVDP